MHFTDENCLMLKNDKKACCRELHAFLSLFGVYVRALFSEMKDRFSLKVIYVSNIILYQILSLKIIIHIHV